jgi:hypothetical protein
MEDITLIINIQGFIFPTRKIAREISYVHLKLPIGETLSVFTPNCKLDKQELGIVKKCRFEIHGLRFKRTPNNREQWISNENVKNYIKNLYELHGGTFAYKGEGIEKEILEELNIPCVDLDLPKASTILGPGCSMQKCIFYKNIILKNEYK